MTRATIIGPGSIGSAVAGVLNRGGASIQVLARDRAKAAELAERTGGTAGEVGDPVTGDVVVLAVPYSALAELAEQYRDQLDGKVVVDVTNPVDLETFDSLAVPADSSAAAELQAALPRAFVVKAFNTTFASAISSGRTGETETTVLVAGDDEAARNRVVELVTVGGLPAIAVGGLRRARELEALAFLQMTLAAQEVVSWGGGFSVQK